MTLNIRLIHLYRLVCIAIVSAVALSSLLFSLNVVMSILVIPFIMLTLSTIFVLLDSVFENIEATQKSVVTITDELGWSNSILIGGKNIANTEIGAMGGNKKAA